MTERSLDIEEMKLLLLTMPYNNYWTVGDYKGSAWKIGLSLKDKIEVYEKKACRSKELVVLELNLCPS